MQWDQLEENWSRGAASLSSPGASRDTCLSQCLLSATEILGLIRWTVAFTAKEFHRFPTFSSASVQFPGSKLYKCPFFLTASDLFSKFMESYLCCSWDDMQHLLLSLYLPDRSIYLILESDSLALPLTAWARASYLTSQLYFLKCEIWVMCQ